MSEACLTTGCQELCVDADIAVTASVTPATPTVTCLSAPAVSPFGAITCTAGVLPCGFSIQATLCVAVPVSFGAAAQTVTIRQQCQQGSATTCVPAPCAFFQPKSQGFLSTNFNLADLSPEAVCHAVRCVEANSPVLARLLLSAPCPAVGAPCPGDLASLAACAELVTTLLTQAGATAAITTTCPTTVHPGALPAVLRQLLAVLLDVCLCTTTTGGIEVGGVRLSFQVNLSGFPASDLAALGLTGTCVTVGQVVNQANVILQTCATDLAGLMAPILTAMAQDVGTTIIVPTPCP